MRSCRERRWRALSRQLTNPVVVREVDEQSRLRSGHEKSRPTSTRWKSPRPQRLLHEFGLTISRSPGVGKSRTTVTNLLRLLSERRREGFRGEPHLEMGTPAACSGSRAAPERGGPRVVARGLSVRETERLVAASRRSTQPRRNGAQPELDPNIRRLLADLTDAWGQGRDATGDQRAGSSDAYTASTSSRHHSTTSSDRLAPAPVGTLAGDLPLHPIPTSGPWPSLMTHHRV